MLSIDCTLSDITVTDNRAYFKDEVVNNNMTISAFAEVPGQCIYTDSMDDEGSPIRTPKLFSELTQYTTDELWATIRTQRNAQLATTDWTQLSDSPLSDEDKKSMVVYRQSLRDIPQNTEKPEDVDILAIKEMPVGIVLSKNLKTKDLNRSILTIQKFGESPP